MKRFLINFILITVAFLIYFLQENFFDWFTIAGVMPNLFVIYILFIGLFSGKNKGMVYGAGIGLMLDILVGDKIGIYAISLALVGLAAGIFAKNFSKDGRMTIMLMVAALTFALELLVYLLNFFILEINFEIFLFLKIVLIEILYNVLLTIILYPLFKKYGYLIEHEYQEDKILTRYF